MSTSREPVILVVDDKPNMLRLMQKVLRADGRVLTAENGAAAVALLEKEPVGVVLSDLRMPDMDGLDVLRACKRIRPGTEFVLMTAYASVATAVEALRLGAYDYVTKPFEPADVRAVVLRALGRASPLAGLGAAPGEEVLPGMVARSPAMAALGALVRKVAARDTTVLLLGETGTGKERIARAIHQLSPRAPERLVAINCAAIPAELLESELFGFARGAFTGAAQARAGLFEQASGGTLMLDEIGEMRPSLQAKLTRAIEERAVRRIGEPDERPVDVRLIAATHRDLEAMVRNETFREDLWYRLNVAVVQVPPLRERQDDIELLAHDFLREHVGAIGDGKVATFADDTMAALCAYGWPGNVRQLRSAVERATVVSTGDVLTVGDLPPEVTGAGPLNSRADLATMTWTEALEASRADTACRYLAQVLQRFKGDIPRAASHAGIERESFYRLMRRYGVR